MRLMLSFLCVFGYFCFCGVWGITERKGARGLGNTQAVGMKAQDCDDLKISR